MSRNQCLPSLKISRRSSCLALWIALLPCLSFAQVAVTTQHNDNSRTGQNTGETYLTPSNVNSTQFGLLFAHPVDGMIVGQPLYLPNVLVGSSIHNLVLVATQHDGVYAFDADSSAGANSAPIWYDSFINPGAGITSVPIANQKCAPETGFQEIGIVGTPVIDQAAGTIFLVAKTLENGTYVHRLHALNVATGAEQPGSPVVISASFNNSKNKNGAVTFDSQHHMQRPGLLLSNGTVFIAFGTLGCTGFAPSTGWLMAYNESLQQLAVFDVAPGQNTIPGVWQGGFGPAADSDGNVYITTGDGIYDADTGGADYGDSLLKLQLGTGGFTLLDYFTPANQNSLYLNDEDIGSVGPLLLPPQPGSITNQVIIAGKGLQIYQINRDNLGQYNPSGDQVISEIPFVDELFGGAAYWNNQVYFGTSGYPVNAYSLATGTLSATPTVQSQNSYTARSTLSISANGATNGIVWFVRNAASSTAGLVALDAVKMNQIYSSPSGVTGTFTHFAVPTIANGKVYLGATQQLVVMGLLPNLTASSGNNQSGTVGQPLASSLQVSATDAYLGQAVPGIVVTFSDGNKGGTFNPPSATTDANGLASTQYTLPHTAGTITVTASGTGAVAGTFTVTASAGAPTSMTLVSGGAQSATVGTTLPAPLVVKLKDTYGNLVSGIPVNFTDNGALGAFSANPVVSGSNGQSSVNYTLPIKSQSITINATYGSLNVKFSEKSLPGSPASLNLAGGNFQAAPRGTQLPTQLSVSVKDQYGNPVANVTVAFSDNGAGGSCPPNAVTNSSGRASVSYTLPNVAGKVQVTATLNSMMVTFSEQAQ